MESAPKPAAVSRSRDTRVLATSGLVLLALVLLTATALATSDAEPPVDAAAASAAGELAPAELPPEWRWERPAVNFDRMIRQR